MSQYLTQDLTDIACRLARGKAGTLELTEKELQSISDTMRSKDEALKKVARTLSNHPSLKRESHLS
jgi:hypothetical protein